MEPAVRRPSGFSACRIGEQKLRSLRTNPTINYPGATRLTLPATFEHQHSIGKV